MLSKMKLKQYPKYKNSGVQWIGDIPEEWSIQRGKFQFKVTGGYAFPSDDFVDKGISLVRIGDISEGIVNLKECKKMPEEYSLTKKEFLLNEKEVLVAMTGATIGKIGQVPKTNEKMLLNQRVGRIKTKHSSDYYKYVLTADFIKEQIRLIAEGAAQENISGEQIESFIIPQLDNLNQTQIASFLDTKTQNIDQTIEKDKKLIELLKEKRIALINHVVTKGLDKNAKMKKSGIDWIGEIPEGWEVNKIKNTSYVKGRIGWQGLSSEEYQDEGAFLVTGTNFKEGKINWESCHHVAWERYKEDPYIHLKENDLLITKDGTIGKIALVEKLPDKTTLNSGVFVVRPLNNKYESKYLYWILNSLIFKRFFDYIKTGATILHLYQDTFERFFFPIPPKPEQKEIVEYLDAQTTKIDQTINKIQEKITLMEEYKKSLIHHVVTGKVDVRGVKA